jgi:hypothetical protein
MKWYQTLNYPRWAVINFIVISIFGLLLRYMQVEDVPWLNYQFVLHAHSHFAFSGWMFFLIAFLIASICTGGKLSPGFKMVLFLTLVSAYGMLASFSWQGYKLLSIGFSTLFVLVTFRFTYLVFKSGLFEGGMNDIAVRLIRPGLFFLCLSSLGPFALGPLAAFGLRNTPAYQDGIYLYLHFQMNGFMLTATLGLLAFSIKLPASMHRIRFLNFFVFSTLPLYFIFTLWAKPGYWLSAFACFGAGLNLLSWLGLVISSRRYWNRFLFIEKTALLALSIKVILQAAIVVPMVGNWAFSNRNLVIGYVHLLTLGITMPLLIGQLIRRDFVSTGIKTAVLNYVYTGLVAFYLSLLFIQPLVAIFHLVIPGYHALLFWLCLLFLCFGAMLLTSIKKDNSMGI